MTFRNAVSTLTTDCANCHDWRLRQTDRSEQGTQRAGGTLSPRRFLPSAHLGESRHRELTTAMLINVGSWQEPHESDNIKVRVSE